MVSIEAMCESFWLPVWVCFIDSIHSRIKNKKNWKKEELLKNSWEL